MLGLADEHAGGRVGVHRDVGVGAARGRGRRDHLALIVRAVEQVRVAAAGAVEEALRRPGGPVGRQRVLLRAPAGLEGERAVRGDAGRGAADRGHVRVRRRVVGLQRAGVGLLVAVVAGGEEERDALAARPAGTPAGWRRRRSAPRRTRARRRSSRRSRPGPRRRRCRACRRCPGPRSSWRRRSGPRRPGAIACTDSTSSVSSPNQPDGIALLGVREVLRRDLRELAGARTRRRRAGWRRCRRPASIVGAA